MEFSEVADKLQQVLYTAETLLPSEEPENIATSDLQQQLLDAKVFTPNILVSHCSAYDL